MRPLKITANLANGYISNDPWSPAIENIIAYWYFKKNTTPEEFSAGCAGIKTSKVDKLPIKIEHFNDDDWWYQASSPMCEKQGEMVSHFNRRFDQLHAEKHMKPKKGRVQVQAGALKNKRNRVVKVLTKKLVWHVVGDEQEIRNLLENCTHIGAQSSRGFGEVFNWSITEGDEFKARFIRPLPVDFANDNNINGTKIHWGYRPNVRDKENQALCILPIEL